MFQAIVEAVREFVVWWLGLFGVTDVFWINGTMTVIAGGTLWLGFLIVVGILAGIASSR